MFPFSDTFIKEGEYCFFTAKKKQERKTVKKIDYVEVWLRTVAASHSGSLHTTTNYRKRFGDFCTFIEATPEEILEDYERNPEKTFKRKYAMLMKTWIGELHKKGYAPNTVTGWTTAVKSFFKYNDLPLGFVPDSQLRVVYFNRDITKEEILQVIAVSRPRERAFYTMMAQTGLRPETLCKLKLKHIEPDFSGGVIPCKVGIPQELAKGKYQGYVTFMGVDSIKALKAYFATRQTMTKDSPVFGGYGENQEVHANRQTFTNHFRRQLEKLKKKEIINFERKMEGKPAELRLYNLRKWFRKNAHQAGFEMVQFWMGHKVKAGVDDHYRPRDLDFHRKLYAEKAMPFLALESATPTETDKVIRVQQKKIEELETKLEKVEPLAEAIATLSPEDLKELINFIKKPKGLLLKTSEEAE